MLPCAIILSYLRPSIQRARVLVDPWTSSDNAVVFFPTWKKVPHTPTAIFGTLLATSNVEALP